MDENVYLSEKATGNKNRALAYMLKAYGMLEDNVEDVLDFYFRACSVKATAVDLAKIAFVLANKGVNPVTGEQIFAAEYAGEEDFQESMDYYNEARYSAHDLPDDAGDCARAILKQKL